MSSQNKTSLLRNELILISSNKKIKLNGPSDHICIDTKNFGDATNEVTCEIAMSLTRGIELV